MYFIFVMWRVLHFALNGWRWINAHAELCFIEQRGSSLTTCLNSLLRLWGVTCMLGGACLLIVTKIIFKGSYIYCLVRSLKVVPLWSCWFQQNQLAVGMLAFHHGPQESSGLVRPRGERVMCWRAELRRCHPKNQVRGPRKQWEERGLSVPRSIGLLACFPSVCGRCPRFHGFLASSASCLLVQN